MPYVKSSPKDMSVMAVIRKTPITIVLAPVSTLPESAKHITEQYSKSEDGRDGNFVSQTQPHVPHHTMWRDPGDEVQADSDGSHSDHERLNVRAVVTCSHRQFPTVMQGLTV